jgi:hypothetical protein
MRRKHTVTSDVSMGFHPQIADGEVVGHHRGKAHRRQRRGQLCYNVAFNLHVMKSDGTEYP